MYEHVMIVPVAERNSVSNVYHIKTLIKRYFIDKTVTVIIILLSLQQEFLSTSSVVTTKPTATVAPVTNVSPPRVIPVPVTNVPPPPRVIPVPVTPRSFDTVSPSLKGSYYTIINQMTLLLLSDYNVPTLPIKVTTPAISNQQVNIIINIIIIPRPCIACTRDTVVVVLVSQLVSVLAVPATLAVFSFSY